MTPTIDGRNYLDELFALAVGIGKRKALPLWMWTAPVIAARIESR
jgi:hypothetical protein